MGKKSMKIVSLLTDSIQKISQTTDVIQISKIVENILLEAINADSATLFMIDKTTKVLYCKNKEDEIVFISKLKGLLSRAFLTKKPAFYNYIQTHKEYDESVDDSYNENIKSQIIFPIVVDDNILGVVRVSRKSTHPKLFTKKEFHKVLSLEKFLVNTLKIIINGNANIFDYEDVASDDDFEESLVDKIELTSPMMFLSNAVHDIRTPANSLYGFLELLEERVEDKRLKSFVQNAKQSAFFINTLTDSILEQTKSSFEIETPKFSIVNSIKYFSSIANIFSANMYDKSITYLIYIDPSIPKEIKVDELKLKRVIINLIGNAYKFTPKKGIVEFRVIFNKEKEYLHVSVKDSGIGIAKDKQKEIFEAFKQAQEDTSVHFGGTGLGLSIASCYVQDMQGSLEIESEEGEGSNFYFELPLDIVTNKPSLLYFENTNKKITILSDYFNCIDVQNIKKYLVELRMPEENIVISNEVSEDTTHLICFEHMLNDELLKSVEMSKVKFLIVEENLFRLVNNSKIENYPIISVNTFYADTVHTFVFSQKKLKILIVDDSKINIMLLQNILELDYAEVSYAMDGLEAFSMIESAVKLQNPYDIVFLDKNMPNMSGDEVATKVREKEKTKHWITTYLVSVTGDANLCQKDLYNIIVQKPFRKKEILEVVQKVPRQFYI